MTRAEIEQAAKDAARKLDKSKARTGAAGTVPTSVRLDRLDGTTPVDLTTDGTLGGNDIYLGEFYSGGDTPLAAGGQYSRSRDVTLPLNASVANGSYYILVATDHYGNEPETNEANNVRASGAITLTVPLRRQPMTTALGGAAIMAATSSIMVGLLVSDDGALDVFRHWQVGSVAGKEATLLWPVAPFVLVGQEQASSFGGLVLASTLKFAGPKFFSTALSHSAPLGTSGRPLR